MDGCMYGRGSIARWLPRVSTIAPQQPPWPHTKAIVDHWHCRQSALRVKRSCAKHPSFNPAHLRLSTPHKTPITPLMSGRGERGSWGNHWAPQAHHHKVELWTHERHADHIISLESDWDSIMWMAPASRITLTDKCYYMQMILIPLMDLFVRTTKSLASKLLNLKKQLVIFKAGNARQKKLH